MCYHGPTCHQKKNCSHKISGNVTKSAHPTSTRHMRHRAMTGLQLFRTPSPKSLISRCVLPFSSCRFQHKEGLPNDILVERYEGPNYRNYFSCHLHRIIKLISSMGRKRYHGQRFVVYQRPLSSTHSSFFSVFLYAWPVHQTLSPRKKHQLKEGTRIPAMYAHPTSLANGAAIRRHDPPARSSSNPAPRL